MIQRFIDPIKLILTGITAILIGIQLYMVFFFAPIEKYMGIVQKIMYFHVPTAFVAFAAFGVVFGAGILYLITKNKKWDYLAVSSAEIGVLFTTFVLILGSMWARPVWNTWWVWDDPRLVTSLILWFIYVAYLLIRTSVKGEERHRKFAAVFGIIGFIDVPLVYFSVLWWRTIHPKVIDENGANMPPEMANTLFFSMFAFMVLFATMLLYRYVLESQREKVKEIRQHSMSERTDF
ncbi:cytochrome c biogenesis protein CcsA [Aquibacillus sp. 3ASR75-11]|uniref:Heme exporter protein C n=1 Tax=Terrihalobacillus insolitus TaxID=2950438 RepID=A0A9X4APQ2_9BACI|nr:cytochrome c biogenesis protein CcsA [Terrihalobacillus insolitus]MDC3414553.1 cytochrome c biogenesis protein CcsA [Terrihalobacillus insolitus]MDC3425770.1 cytochrome c biogenesis protein CcsA [Terrihalobacillus insolitus]